MQVKIKKLREEAVIPVYAKQGDAGLDLTAVSVKIDQVTGAIVYGTGLAIEIPQGYFGLIAPRSSIVKTDLFLKNSVGIIDSGYRGELMINFGIDYDYWIEADEKEEFLSQLENGKMLIYETAEQQSREWCIEYQIYKVGERVAQLLILPYPEIELEEVEELSSTERGEGGFGSTGK